MSIYTIYKITNLTNNKAYIGFTSNFKNRMREHKKGYLNSTSDSYNCVFYRALRKYGYENFTFEQIYQSKDKHHTLKEMEPYFIDKYRTYVGFDDCNGYNMTVGGEGAPGITLTDEHKKFLSELQIRRFSDKNNRDKHSESMKKWWEEFPEERKAEASKKRSEKLMGNNRASGMTYSHSEDAKRKISEANLGKIFTQESIEKLKVNRKGKGVGDTNAMAKEENRNKVRDSKIGRKLYINPETLERKYCIPGNEPEGFILNIDFKKGIK